MQHLISLMKTGAVGFIVDREYLLDFLAILESVYLKAIANHKFQEEFQNGRTYSGYS